VANVVLAAPAAAASASSCQQFGVMSVADGTYDVQTDEWNSSATQCVSTDGNADFSVTQSSIDTGTNAPGSYPSIFRGCHWGTCTQNSDLPIEVANLGDPTTSWSTSEPETGVYDVNYDVWFNQEPTTQGQPNGAELMIWLNHSGQVQPAGAQVGSVSLDGLQFDVWFDAAEGFNSVAYELESPRDSVSDLDLGNLVRDAQARGYIDPGWYLIDVEAGFEIWSGGAGLTTNSFSFNPVSWSSSGPPTTRLAGSDAIATAIAVSDSAFPRSGSAAAVVVARSDYFADALTGAPLAAALGGPLLLTPGASESTTLDARTLAEIQRVLAPGGSVFLLGGSLAISSDIDPQLTSLGYRVQRIAGADEFATAVDIAEQLGNPSTIFEVTGLDFHDAVSAGPAAVADHGAILLTDGAEQAPETAAYLAAHPGDVRYAIGGSFAALGADPSAIGVFGPDAYGTAAAVASRFFPDPSGVGIATSSTFSDALVSAPLLGALDHPLLSVPSTGSLPADLVGYLAQVSASVGTLVVFGGTAAVSDAVVSEIDTALA
jgi:putative cell wall-binding protein